MHLEPQDRHPAFRHGRIDAPQLDPCAFTGAVAAHRADRRAVVLDEHGVVDSGTEGLFKNLSALQNIFMAATRVVLSGSVFATTRLARGVTTVMSHGILNSGSSQHGNASRAATASNWLARKARPPLSNL